MELPGFRDLEPIGKGGLGIVYRALRIATGGRVAIKVVTAGDPGQTARSAALQEVDAMIRLKSHPNVINVEDLIDTPEGPGIVMEYAAGGSLTSRVRSLRGPVSVPEQVLVGQHLAAALDAAHRLAVVHRDVKPSNVLITNFGICKVGDFGIAGLQWREQANSPFLTTQYASPEELEVPGSGGAAADVYAFGLTMLYLRCGRTPEPADRAGLLADADDPAADALVRLLGRCVGDEPWLRPRSIDLAAELDQISLGLGPQKLRRLPPVSFSLDDLDDEHDRNRHSNDERRAGVPPTDDSAKTTPRRSGAAAT